MIDTHLFQFTSLVNNTNTFYFSDTNVLIPNTHLITLLSKLNLIPVVQIEKSLLNRILSNSHFYPAQIKLQVLELLNSCLYKQQQYYFELVIEHISVIIEGLSLNSKVARELSQAILKHLEIDTTQTLNQYIEYNFKI